MTSRTEVPFYRHDLGEPELESLRRVLEGPILTTGAVVREFESRFASYLGVREVVGVTSCTGAIHLCLLALKVGPGDEVITTPMTFIATAAAIMEAGALPVLVDVEAKTGNIDISAVERAISPRTRAILPVHLYGQMCDMRALRDLADRHEISLVEDAAHCVEGARDGVRPAGLSDAACFSFYATKNLTCGEGGAIATNDVSLAKRLRLLRLHGMTKTAADRESEGYSHWDMVELGWKYNMDNIQASLLLPQLDRLDAKWAQRVRLADRYRHELADLEGLDFPEVLEDTRHAWHLFVARIGGGLRDTVIDSLYRRGISVMVNYRPIHLLSYFRRTLGYSAGSFPTAELFGSEVVSLPFYPTMPDSHLHTVTTALRSCLVSSNVSAPRSDDRID